MIVVGARFRALAGARAALRDVRASVDVGPGDVAVRPLGTTRYEAPSDEFVVAGRFEPRDVEAVVTILHANGGRVIERRLEAPRKPPDEAAAGAQRGPSPASPSTPAKRAVGRGRTANPARAWKRPRRPSPPLWARTARLNRIGG